MSRHSLLLWLALAASIACEAQEPRPAAQPAAKPGTVLVTGANRGLGLEFAAQYAAAGWNVIATARDPAGAAELRALAASNRKVSIEELDVSEQASIAALAAKYAHTPIDVLINNAGVLGDLHAQTLGSLEHAEFERVMDVNVYGALAMAEAFRDQVAASEQKKIVSITSRSGTISQPGYRGPYFYRASKIALNMVMRVLADDLRERGVIVALVAPYPTDTEMLRTLIGPEAAARQARPADSVAGMIRVIDRLTLDNASVALLADGKPLPW
jgi:NAD(P)-dependent dehydrogenase (short-subunit alcohol dehydrogenase family)